MSTRPSDVIVADMVIVGGGPAGIAAATRAAESGRRVVLLDESPQVGGQIWRHQPGRAIPIARRWIARLERSGATVLSGASVVDMRERARAIVPSRAHVVPSGADVVPSEARDLLLPKRFAVTGERHLHPLLIEADAIVLATGARERFIPFPGWTMPGVIGIGGAQALLKAGMSFAGKRVVIAGSGPLLLPVAAALVADGARLLLVAEQGSRRAVARFATGLWRRPGALLQAARYRAGFAGTPYKTGTWVTAAHGDGRLQEVSVTDGTTTRTIACDVLCAAYGLVPNTELARLLGCETAHGAVVVDDRQETTVAGVYCVGESTGIGGVDLSLVEGEIGGLCAGDRDASAHALHGRRAGFRTMAHAMERAFAPRAELRELATPETIVCRCEDVPLGALSRHWSARQAKLYTRAGMGPCQGRVCGASLEFLFGWPADATRVPSEPALLSTLLADTAHDAGAPLHLGV